MRYTNLNAVQLGLIKNKIDNFTNNRKLVSKKAASALDVYSAEINMKVGRVGKNLYNVDVTGRIVDEFEGQANMSSGSYRLIGKINRSLSPNSSVARGLTNGVFSKNEKDIKKFVEWTENINFGRCDCCNVNRSRDEVYIIANEDNGEWKQVGTSCVEDICKQKNLIQTMDAIDKIAHGDYGDAVISSRSFNKILLESDKFATCALAVSHFGLISLGTPDTFKKHALGESSWYFDSTYGSKLTLERDFKKADKSDETSTTVGSSKDSLFTKWTKFLYKTYYCDIDGNDNIRLWLDKAAVAISGDRNQTFENYMNSKDVQDYVSEILDGNDFNIENNNVELYDYDRSVIKCNLYVQSAGETIVQSIADYVDSNPKKCGVGRFFHNDIICEAGVFLSGVDDEGDDYFLDIDKFVMFGPDDFKYTNLVNLVNDGSIKIPEHSVMIGNDKTIILPECTYNRDGSLDDGILISNDGYVLGKRGNIRSLANFDGEYTYEELSKFVNMCERKTKMSGKTQNSISDKSSSKSGSSDLVFINDAFVSKSKSGCPYAVVYVGNENSDNCSYMIFDENLSRHVCMKNGRRVNIDSSSQRVNLVYKPSDIVRVRYLDDNAFKYKNIRPVQLRDLHSDYLKSQRLGANNVRPSNRTADIVSSRSNDVVVDKER